MLFSFSVKLTHDLLYHILTQDVTHGMTYHEQYVHQKVLERLAEKPGGMLAKIDLAPISPAGLEERPQKTRAEVFFSSFSCVAGANFSDQDPMCYGISSCCC